MRIKEIKQRPDINENVKLNNAYLQYAKLLCELRKKELPNNIVNSINNDIKELNLISDSGKKLRNQIRKKQSRILRLIEKDLKVVPKNHYRNTWSVFGIPIGAAFGASLGNMPFLGIGLPIGLVIGIVIGTRMDKKAFEEGRQLDLELKY